jgi:hypothetical protein
MNEIIEAIPQIVKLLQHIVVALWFILVFTVANLICGRR